MSYYEIAHLLMLGVLMYMTHSGSRAQFNQERKGLNFVDNMNHLLGTDLDECASMDAVFYLLKKMEPSELEGLIREMVSALLKNRVLEKFRFDGEYLIAVDATEIYRSKIPHCEHCLVQKHKNGEIDYFHTVLEAKLVTPDGMTFTLESLFVENGSSDYSKQDCELAAFYRLSERLKAHFPRLRICLLMDSLYANEKVLEICGRNGWSYFVTLKEGSIPTLYKRAMESINSHPENSLSLLDHQGKTQHYQWACNLQHKSQTTHFITALIPTIERKTKRKSQPNKKEYTRFVYLTDIRPSEETIATYINSGGRQRAKIEDSFNIQKNCGLNLEHNYGAQGNAYKNSYYLLQIAHILLQLITHSDLVSKVINKTHSKSHSLKKKTIRFKTVLMIYKSVKNYARRLCESLRCMKLSDFSIDPLFARTIKVKLIFDSS